MSRIPVVFLQGFGPFGRFADNPSQLLVEDLLAHSPWAGAAVVGEVLPVTNDAASRIQELWQQHRPDIWVGVGLAAGRARVCLERVAVNVADYGIRDQDGNLRDDESLVDGGPVAYRSTLPDRQIRDSWQAEDLPGAWSYTAGTYLCNQAFYLARHASAADSRPTQVGFIHIPATVAMSGGQGPALPLAVIRSCLVTAVRVAVSQLSAAGNLQTAATTGTPR